MLFDYNVSENSENILDFPQGNSNTKQEIEYLSITNHCMSLRKFFISVKIETIVQKSRQYKTQF